ncbi:hypothetical protein WJX82_007096 [Trebouxia sp. C0006]
MDFTSVSEISSISGLSRPASFALPQQQLTSMLSFPQARSFSSSGDSGDFTNSMDAATSASAFDPSAVLDAVLGAEEDGWAGAREDVWFFNRYMQSVLRFAQVTTGLPWWETIAMSTLFFRIMTIPFHLQSVRNTYNMTKAKPEVERLAAQLRQEQENKNPKAMEDYQRKLAGIWKRNNCHPVKSVLPILIQAPVFIGFFSSLQSLARAKIPSLMEGGTAWFTDLTVSDTTMVLPFMAFGVFLLSAELGGADGMQGQPPHVIQRFKWAMRILTAVMVPFAKDLPASVFIYWVTSNTWSFIQSMVLKQTAVKRVWPKIERHNFAVRFFEPDVTIPLLSEELHEKVLSVQANKEGKGRSGSKKQQQRKKTTGLRENTSSQQGAARLPYRVASCRRLTWWPFLSVYILLVVMMYGLLDSATLGAALSAMKRAVLATLPDFALRQIIGQISSVVMVTAAVVAALAENACRPSHKDKSTGTDAVHQALLVTLTFTGFCVLLEESSSATSSMGQQVRTIAASLVEDAIVCSKMDFYTLLPMIFAVVANCMRKDLLVWSAKAGYDLLALEIRMWELLPASLMVAMIFALVVEGCFVLTFKRMSPDTTLAGMMANATRATFFQPGHKQALILGVKLALFVTLSFAGLCVVLEELTSPNSSLGQQISTAIGSLMEAADVFVKMTCSIVIPMASLDLANSARKRVLVQSAEAEYLLALESRLWELLPASLMVAAIVALVAEGCYVLYCKRMSPHTNTANIVDDATVTTSSQTKHQQVNVAVPNSEHQKHADELQHLREKTTGSANVFAVVQPSDSSKPLETIRAAGSPSPKRQPVGTNNDPSHNNAGGRRSNITKQDVKNSSANKAASNNKSKLDHKPAAVEAEVNWDDGYLAAVRALLTKAVGEPCLAQLQIAQSLAWLLKAVPAWMLTFGDANNQGCTAHAGLQAFQSALSGKRTTSKLQTVLRDVSKVKSMALLLRTVVAADVQGLVQPSLSSHKSDERLMAKDILRLIPDKVPEWQLSVLRQKLALTLRSS